ncbi:acetate--CoA ligase family protein [Streptomyces sp. MUM 203J]|uniref:acetate--CoA ligase family protein n=1 Tax=Streptomyces sp. MUM 203J TaxID=2791990 RepID=UPI001F047888|nr:acetate--CoA ligase family protein [Streptomyces sp. MUM 203J]MCH0542878.1 acetate--CoA ligase family protein [Streptomyces sp. MUM 203J]
MLGPTQETTGTPGTPDLDGLFRPEVVVVASAADTEAVTRTPRWVERWAAEVGAKILPAEAAEGTRVDVAVIVGEQGLAAGEHLWGQVRFAVMDRKATAVGGTGPTGPARTEHAARVLGGARLVGPTETEPYEVVGGLREQRGDSPGVALIARHPWQLHTLGGALRKAGARVPYRMATGDETDLAAPEVIAYLTGREDVGAIACHLDAVRDGRALHRALDLAARRAVPVVAYAPAPDPVLAAALRQFGVVRVDRPDQLQDTAALLAHARRPPGTPAPPDTVAVYAPAADGYLMDAARAAGLTAVRTPTPEAALTDPEVGVLVLTASGGAPDSGATARTVAKPVCVVADQEPPPGVAPRTTVFRTPANCAAAIRSYLDHARFVTHYRPASVEPSLSLRKARALLDLEPRGAAPYRILTAHAAKQLLRAYGIRVPREQLVTSAAAAVRAAARVGYPVVLKACAPEGGSRVGLTSAGQVREAYRDMAAAARRMGVPLDGVVVAQLIDGGVELAVSVTRDPRFGPVVTVRPAGDLAPLADAAVRVAPFDEPTARDLLHELRAGPLLAALDADALADTLLRLQRLAVELADDLTELHVAPLAVRRRGRGTAALDATATLRRAPAAG